MLATCFCLYFEEFERFFLKNCNNNENKHKNGFQN
jgi:hypothetical protein